MGTGLKKWSPPNLSSLLVAEAISEMGSELVLLASMVFSGALLSYSLNSFCFSPIFSTTASTTRSADAMALSTEVSTARLLRAMSINLPAPSASSLNCFLATLLILSVILLLEESRTCWLMSTSVTLCPVLAATWAMPAPISPPPTTTSSLITGAERGEEEERARRERALKKLILSLVEGQSVGILGRNAASGPCYEV